MSLLINETYANKEVPLWLDEDLTSTPALNVLTPNVITQTLAGNGTIVSASLTFSTPINYAKLTGWMGIVCQSLLGSNSNSLYLTSGVDTTFNPAIGTQLTGVDIADGINAETYVLLDNLVYFNSTPFTVLNLILKNDTASSVNVSCQNAYASNTYSALPTISGWTASLGGGSLVVTAGLV
jgi:hypothetical protein